MDKCNDASIAHLIVHFKLGSEPQKCLGLACLSEIHRPVFLYDPLELSNCLAAHSLKLSLPN